MRELMPEKAFAIPESRTFPIHDAYHATSALSHLLRIAGRHGSQPAVAKKVLQAVHKRWPDVYACESDLVAKIRKVHHLA